MDVSRFALYFITMFVQLHILFALSSLIAFITEMVLFEKNIRELNIFNL